MFTLLSFQLKICLINQKRIYFAPQSPHYCSIHVSYLCDRGVPGVCPAVSHHRQTTTEARFCRVRSCALFFICEHLQFCTFRKLSLVFIFSVAHHGHAVQKKVIVSVNLMNSGKMSCYFLRDRRKNRCALCVKTPFS